MPGRTCKLPEQAALVNSESSWPLVPILRVTMLQNENPEEGGFQKDLENENFIVSPPINQRCNKNQSLALAETEIEQLNTEWRIPEF